MRSQKFQLLWNISQFLHLSNKIALVVIAIQLKQNGIKPTQVIEAGGDPNSFPRFNCLVELFLYVCYYP